jgi:uncharacterized protein YkwD
MVRARIATASRLAAAVLLGLAAGCASRPPAGAPVRLVRRGPDRAETAYSERAPEAKVALLARINADRAAAGVPPVAYDLVAAKAADAFCLDTARTHVMGHWDLAGRAPYDRYADAGGVDWSGENFSGTSRTGGAFPDAELTGLLLEAHGRMMAERPPDDGHRRNVLDPDWTHVGIGVALVAGEFRMTEEFTRHVVDWVELPAQRVRAGREAPVAVRLPKGWTLAAVEIAHERFPSPLTAKEIARRRAYAFPPASQRILPVLPSTFHYVDGSRGEVAVSNGLVRVNVALLSGPGSYWVLVYAAPGEAEGRTLSPLTAIRIMAD